MKARCKSPEYDLYGAIALYLKLQYPRVMYHFDPTGLSLSKTQAGKLKAIQKESGYPDLFIIEPDKNGQYKGLLIEIKPEGTNIYKKDHLHYKDDHVREQALFLDQLIIRGFKAVFGVGFDNCKRIIDSYLRG
jgi:hypothetical protein